MNALSTDGKAHAELLLLASIEIGLHEQTRLQPKTAEALDVAFWIAATFVCA